MKPKVYIDGKDGTTGLQIYDRLSVRDDIDLLLIDEDKRKDPIERKKLMDGADIVFLCLPDAAAVEAVDLVENPNTRIIDASTAHRTDPDWDYGFPELSAERRTAIQKSKRVANPGCHATGFISVVYPLVAMGLLPRDGCLSAFSLTGYSGGGKKMIAQYEAPDKGTELFAPCPYGMGQGHKHLPEMQKVCGLANKPVFTPIVDDYYKGMATTVPFHMSQMQGVSTLAEVRQKLSDYYAGAPLVQVVDTTDSAKLDAYAQAGKDTLKLIGAGNDQQFTITSLF
ncbi:N-acetyl-gamma-glutamyl-phosphate reductase, partial [Dysosmobacter sp.]|uniref:N-acetyl-gamma-glutamyl-phosphate reductase n=1 Tax=Dysosmobacter sp. TaxID=2591382 RepID=UPI002A88FCF7